MFVFYSVFKNSRLFFQRQHLMCKDRYYGFDDAVYAGCRIIEILAEKKRYNKEFKISDMLEPFNKMYCSSEVRLSCPNSLKKITRDTERDNYMDSNEALKYGLIDKII